jgi:hypothetical protein
MKMCNKCKTFKPLDRFALKGVGKTARRGTCKDCTNAYEREAKKRRRWKGANFDLTAVVQPARMSVFDRPVYVPPKWGR